MCKRCLNLAVLILLIAALGFLLPLVLARRMTLVGLLVSLAGFSLGLWAPISVAREFGPLPAIAVAIRVNLAVAGFWLRLIVRITQWMRGQRPVP